MINVVKSIVQFCIAKGIKAEKQRIELTAKLALSRYSEEQIISALNNLIFTHEFFPDVANISKAIESNMPSEIDEANEMAGAIIESIGRFGNYQAKEAMLYLGQEAWLVVERFGGWLDLCKITNSEMPMVRAQLRDLSKSCSKIGNRKTSKIQYKQEAIQRLSGLKLVNELIS